jgi:hypothetical protein
MVQNSMNLALLLFSPHLTTTIRSHPKHTIHHGPPNASASPSPRAERRPHRPAPTNKDTAQWRDERHSATTRGRPADDNDTGATRLTEPSR